MVPKIWSAMDNFFVILEKRSKMTKKIVHCTPYQKNKKNKKKKIFEKMKKTPGDVIILHKCTINDNHVWFMRYQT